jgi:formate-dependent nitrite reductase membrane component NrfD
MTSTLSHSSRSGRPGKGKRRRDEHQMVPDATFTSYYGRPVVKPSPWQNDIPAYLFLGGLAGGSSLLAAGADLTGRPALRRASRLGAAGAISLSFAALVHDLGKPSRFLNMLRVAKPTSPMSVGTWILSGYGPLAGLAGAAELAAVLPLPGPIRRLVARLGRPAGLCAAGLAPAIASYTAVLLADTATPAWSEARRELPFVFAGSAAAAAGGLALLGSPTDQAGPARRLAVAGAAVELAAQLQMEQSMGLVAETTRRGKAGALMRTSQLCMGLGTLGALVGRRSRLVSGLAGTALLIGSACTRFGIFEAGQASAADPKYTVLPQRTRIEERGQPADQGI